LFPCRRFIGRWSFVVSHRRHHLKIVNWRSHGSAEAEINKGGESEDENHPPADINQHPARNRIGRHHEDPTIQKRQALDRFQRIHCLVTNAIDEVRGRQQDLSPQAVGRERNGHALHRRLVRWVSRNGRCRLRLDYCTQGCSKGAALSRVIQHIQRCAGLIGRDAGRCWRRPSLLGTRLLDAGLLCEGRRRAGEQACKKNKNEGACHPPGTTTTSAPWSNGFSALMGRPYPRTCCGTPGHSRAAPPAQIRFTPYSIQMHGLLTALIGILMLCTLGVLIAGLFGMVREGDPRRANKLMQWRVLLQGATILLFVIFMTLLGS
jgi:hypothetical protein